MRGAGFVWLFVGFAASAQVPARSFFTLPSSNGHGAVVVDTQAAKVTHWRERLSATEEPQLDANGNEVWVGNQLQVVQSRDLLFDDYFGFRANGTQTWLTNVAPSSSGYADGGTGVVTFSQSYQGLELTTYVFSPRALPAASLVKVLCIKNPSTNPAPGLAAFSLDNFHLGFGRPGVMTPLQPNGETVTIGNNTDIHEQGFAGVVVTRALWPSNPTAWNPSTPNSQNEFFIVQDGGTADVPLLLGSLGTHDDWATGFEFPLGDLSPGAQTCIGTVSVHSANPFDDLEPVIDAYVGTVGAQQLVEAELASWNSFQNSLTVPQVDATENAVLHQSAAVLEMAQVKDSSDYLREWLSMDGEPRYTRFLAADAGVTLPRQVPHEGYGAVLASLPPGQWTISWVRDGTYSAVAMAQLGLQQESKDELEFLLDAVGGRFRSWNELMGYGLLPYQVSLVRYTGFGVEETDENAFGPNFEFDGFGLTLWALRAREVATLDQSLVNTRWNDIATLIADPLAALVDPATGLLRPDSSIWESHWNGRQRSWTYSNIVAVRGLCDAAALAERMNDSTRASKYRTAALALRRAIAARLTDSSHALASNAEELAEGSGYYDAAVVEAINLGLFRPDGAIAQATLDALDAKLRVTAGPGWARNDDLTDHAGGNDLSPWGSDYDSAEWAFTDLRGSVAMRIGGRTARADALLDWTTQQAAQGTGLVPETYDPMTGAWKFNAPMVGFGAGAYVLALQHRGAPLLDPACGVYFEDETATDGGTGGGAGGGAGGGGSAAGGGSATGGGNLGTGGGSLGGGAGGGGGSMSSSGCNCSSGGALSAVVFGALLLRLRRRHRKSLS